MKAIQGKWINLYDEKELKDQFLCMSAKLLQFDDNNEKELSFQQANSIYEDQRQALIEQGAEEARNKYFINNGRKAVFKYDDPSAALIQHMSVQVANELAKEDDPNEFNEVKWDDMMVRQMQILDTDYVTYMLVYTCQENVEYTDKKS